MAFDDCQIKGDNNKAGSVLVKVEDKAVSDAASEVDGGGGQFGSTNFGSQIETG